MCRCGTAFLLLDALKLDIAAGPEIPVADDVNPADLLKVISNASSPRLEVTARRNYWRYLNDGYREQYRAHRAAEDAISNTWWRRVYRASLSALQHAGRKLLGTKPKSDAKTKLPFTVPAYNPTSEQADNMKRLLPLILGGAEKPFKIDWLEVAELHRELSQFESAALALNLCTEAHQLATKNVICKLIERPSAAPMRFRK
jgi:hypothetical protein